MPDAARNPEVLRLKLKSKRIPRPVADVLRSSLHWLFGYTRFNKFYSELPPCEPDELAAAMLDRLGIRFETQGLPLEQVPESGPLIVIANHPFGLPDALALNLLLGKKRPEGALMAVHEMAPLTEFHGRIILVGRRGQKGRRRFSTRGWREAIELLESGGALAIFPAGGVARFRWRRLAIVDDPWSPHVGRIARRTGARILPLWFHGRNSRAFHVVGALLGPVQALMIINELIKMRDHTLRVTVGEVIEPAELTRFSTDEQATAYLRQRTEILAGRADR